VKLFIYHEYPVTIIFITPVWAPANPNSNPGRSASLTKVQNAKCKVQNAEWLGHLILFILHHLFVKRLALHNFASLSPRTSTFERLPTENSLSVTIWGGEWAEIA